MPESLKTLLQHHVDQLSHRPPAGFSGVRAKARRRTQRRVGTASLVTAGVVILGLVLGNAGGGKKHVTPTAPVPKAAPLLDTHWRFDSITANGHTLSLDDEQDYLTMGLNGWLMREHCQNIGGGVTLGQQVQLFTVVKGSGACQQQPLPRAVTEVLHSPLTDVLSVDRLTLQGATGSMSFTAEPASDATTLTSRVWRLSQVQDTTGNLALEQKPTPGRLLLEFGNGHWLADDGCNQQQGLASVTGGLLDLTGGPTAPGGTCPQGSAHLRVAAAYAQLVKDGRVLWNVSDGKLELRGVATTLTFVDAGPASALAGP